MANKQIISMMQKQRSKLESRVTQAEKSIAAWKGEMESLDGAISSLSGTGGRKVGRPKGSGRRKRGTWKEGSPGRPPKWFTEQKKAKSKGEPAKKAAKPKAKKRKRKPSAKMLAGLAKARAALAAKRKAAEKQAKAG
jgi:hypothetical protein